MIKTETKFFFLPFFLKEKKVIINIKEKDKCVCLHVGPTLLLTPQNIQIQTCMEMPFNSFIALILHPPSEYYFFFCLLLGKFGLRKKIFSYL